MGSPPQSYDPVWDAKFRVQEWGKYPPEHVIRFVARNFYARPDRKAVRLLDLGCGPGANTWFMAREGFSVSAIDGSPTAIEQLTARLKKEGLTADARIGDFTSLPWEDGTFDGAVDNAALCTNPWPAARLAVAEVARVLKPGGVFCSAHFTDRCWGYGSGEEIEPGGFRELTEGPIAHLGFCRLLGRAQIGPLYQPFTDIEVDRLVQTLGGDRHQIEQWVVLCRKR
jgi:SAM-dependent methyltransferase